MAAKTFTFEELKRITEKYTSVTVKETKSGCVLCTEYGARILGFFPSVDKPNTLWVHNDLDKIMSQGNWMTGGERLWVAPEREFYYENPRDFEGFHVPTGIDPGEFTQTDDLRYENIFSLLDYQKNEAFDDTVALRQFEMIDDPYDSGLDFAGVHIKDYLSVSEANIAMSAWSIAQVYTCGPETRGTCLFPIKQNGSIVSYFDPIPSNRGSVEDGYARFMIDGNAIYKFAIRPEDIDFTNPVKAAYISPFPDKKSWFLVVKRTDDMPRSQQECVDVAKGNPNGPKGAIQSYNNGPGFEPGEVAVFGEIELQLNKGITIDNRTISAAYHDILGYTGSKDAVLALAKRILRSPSEPKLF